MLNTVLESSVGAATVSVVDGRWHGKGGQAPAGLTARSGADAPDGDGGDDVTALHTRLQWLERTADEYEAAGFAADVLAATDQDKLGNADDLDTEVAELQDALFDSASRVSVDEVLRRRLQEAAEIARVVYPAPEEATDERQDVAQMMRWRDERVGEFMQMSARVRELEAEIARVQADSTRVRLANRQVHKDVEAVRAAQRADAAAYDDEDELRDLREARREAYQQNTIIRNVFTGMVVESGVNWAANDQLRELVLSLGESPVGEDDDVEEDDDDEDAMPMSTA